MARFRPFNEVENNLNGMYPPNTVQNLVRFEDHNVVKIIESSMMTGKERNQSVESSRNDGVMRHTFKFDKVFGPEQTQEDLFQFVGKEISEDALKGFNSTVMAYG